MDETVHKRNHRTGGPLCLGAGASQTDDVTMHDNIDVLTCVSCLRMLAKDAVIYGNGRRPSREW
jgi:hypothetical protein